MFIIILGYFTIIATLNFPTYLLREIAMKPCQQWGQMLFHQWIFLSLNAIPVILLVIGACAINLIEFKYLFHFILLLILVTTNNQYENFHVAVKKPAWGAAMLLLRSSWIIPLFVLNYFGFLSRELSYVFIVWATTELVTVIISSILVVRWGYFPERFYKIDLRWIHKGVRVGIGYSLLALLLMLIVNIQRVILGQYHSSDSVGAFHFYYMISVFFPNLIEATVFAIVLPNMIVKNKQTNIEKLAMPEKKYLYSMILLSFTSIISVASFLPCVLNVVGKSKLLEYRYLFYYTGIFAMLYSIARIFHYQLFSSHKDRLLGIVYCISGIISVLSSFAIIPKYGLKGAGVSLVISGGSYLMIIIIPFFMCRLVKRFKYAM